MRTAFVGAPQAGAAGNRLHVGEDILAKIAGAKRPLVLAGTGIRLADSEAEFLELVEKLGSYSYFESASCAFNGLDKQYDYGSFVLTTYPIDEVDYVNSVELKDDLVKTAEGVAIGASEEDVKAAYGEPATAGDYSYTKGDSKLLFVVKDGKVSSIQYIAVTK